MLFVGTFLLLGSAGSTFRVVRCAPSRAWLWPDLWTAGARVANRPPGTQCAQHAPGERGLRLSAAWSLDVFLLSTGNPHSNYKAKTIDFVGEREVFPPFTFRGLFGQHTAINNPPFPYMSHA
jgi:hypothetical protein